MRARFAPILLVVALVPLPARAQEPPAETAAALFNRAQEHMKRGEPRAACPLFAESLRRDPQVGTLLNLALCEERTGALATALAHYREAADKLAATNGDPKFVAFARKHEAELDPRVPRLTIRLGANPPPGTRVLRGGEELASAALGVALPVNPGAIEVTVIAPGRQDRRDTVTVAEGERKEVVVEPGAEVAAAPPPAPPPEAVPPVATPIPVAPVVADAEPSWAKRHRASLVLGGAAAGLALAGIALGAVTKADYFDLQKTCMPGPCNDGDRARLHREMWATNGLLIAASATAAAGVVVFVVEARKSAPGVTVAAEAAGAKVMLRY